jgi:hypothetical protein
VWSRKLDQASAQFIKGDEVYGVTNPGVGKYVEELK